MKVVPILALTAKWLLVPAAFGVVGYYVVGPRIGDTPVKTASAQTQNPLAVDAATGGSKYAGKGPDVEIKARPGASLSSSSSRSKKKRRRRRRSTSTQSSSSSSSSAPAAAASSPPPSSDSVGTGG